MRAVSELQFEEMLPVNAFVGWLDSCKLRMVHSGGVYLFSDPQLAWSLTEQWEFVATWAGRKALSLPLRRRPAYVQAQTLDSTYIPGSTISEGLEQLHGYDLLAADGGLIAHLALAWPYPEAWPEGPPAFDDPQPGLRRPLDALSPAAPGPTLWERIVSPEEAWSWALDNLPYLGSIADGLPHLAGTSTAMAELHCPPDHHWGAEPLLSGALELSLLRGKRKNAVLLLDPVDLDRARVTVGISDEDEELSWTGIDFLDEDGAVLYRCMLYRDYDGLSFKDGEPLN